MITLLVWFLWISILFIFNGATFVLPLIISKKTAQQIASFWDNPFTMIISPSLAEIPAAVLCYYLIDHPRFGRKNLLLYSLSITMIAYLVCYFMTVFFFIFFFVLGRFSFVLGYSGSYTYTSELYHTSVRSTAVGMASAIGRFGAIFMPIVLLSSLNVSIAFPFLVLSIVCLLRAVAVFFFPLDTYYKKLDFEF